jgi:hypothetical protein
MYLNGVYMINSVLLLPMPNTGVKTVKYVGKGAIIVSGDISISCDILPKDDNALLVLASVGAFAGKNKKLRDTKIYIQGGPDKRFEVVASLVALNRGVYGKVLPCFIVAPYSVKLKGNWIADQLSFYPQGSKDEPNEKHKGLFITYDKERLTQEKYCVDIAPQFAYWHIYKNKSSEL